MSSTSHAAAQTAHKMLLSSLNPCRKIFDLMSFGVRKRDRESKQNVGELFSNSWETIKCQEDMKIQTRTESNVLKIEHFLHVH